MIYAKIVGDCSCGLDSTGIGHGWTGAYRSRQDWTGLDRRRTGPKTASDWITPRKAIPDKTKRCVGPRNVADCGIPKKVSRKKSTRCVGTRTVSDWGQPEKAIRVKMKSYVGPVSGALVKVRCTERLEDFGRGPSGKNSGCVCDVSVRLPIPGSGCESDSNWDLGFGVYVNASRTWDHTFMESVTAAVTQRCSNVFVNHLRKLQTDGKD